MVNTGYQSVVNASFLSNVCVLCVPVGTVHTLQAGLRPVHVVSR